MTSCEKESYKTETHLFFTVDMLEDAEVTYGMTTTFSRSGNPEIHGSKYKSTKNKGTFTHIVPFTNTFSIYLQLFIHIHVYAYTITKYNITQDILCNKAAKSLPCC